MAVIVHQMLRLVTALCVCHCSSGNHAAALALAASLRGIPAYIVVPNNAPACKMAAVKEYGGNLLAVTLLHPALQQCCRLWVHVVLLTCDRHQLKPVDTWFAYTGNTRVQLVCVADVFCTAVGHLMLCEPTMTSREATCERVAAETGATIIPPYDHGPVIAGQGTIGLEMLQQVG